MLVVVHQDVHLTTLHSFLYPQSRFQGSVITLRFSPQVQISREVL